MRRLLALAACLFLGGCALVFRAPTPMPQVARSVGTDPRCLVVFLPGFGDGEGVFAEHGFVDALAERRIAVDTISAGATFGYYARRNVVERLEADVLEPAWKRRSYAETWLVGVSMGGMGALLVARGDPRITGMLLLAPYLGDEDVISEIERAGGLARWDPPSPSEDDWQRELWLWLRSVTARPADRPLYLGAGETDRLGRGHRLLAGALDFRHIYRTTGGHDWAPWGRLWGDFLDHSEFVQRCSPRREGKISQTYFSIPRTGL